MGQKIGKESRESNENVKPNVQPAKKKNAGADHQKFTIGGNSDQRRLVRPEERQKAQQELDKMRRKYKLEDTTKVDVSPTEDNAQADAPKLYRLDKETKKQLRDVKNKIKEMLPILQVVLEKDKAFLSGHLVDEDRFLGDVTKAMRTRLHAAVYVHSGFIDRDPEAFRQELSKDYKNLTDHLKQLSKKPGEIAAQFTTDSTTEIEMLGSINENTHTYSIDSKNVAAFQKLFDEAGDFSAALFTDTGNPKQDFLIKADALLKLRKANQELVKIIHEQGTTEDNIPKKAFNAKNRKDSIKEFEEQLTKANIMHNQIKEITGQYGWRTRIEQQGIDPAKFDEHRNNLTGYDDIIEAQDQLPTEDFVKLSKTIKDTITGLEKMFPDWKTDTSTN